MSKPLVAFFSASGITAGIARQLATAIHADLFEIKPATPYTTADLDWTDSNSRSNIEMNVNRSFRPAILNQLENMEEYDTIFLGFPIWWYIAPTIVNTFLESYTLTGKTIIPFATSGVSGMGNTNQELIDSCKGAHLLEGKRFDQNATLEELKTWAETIQ